MVKEPFSLSFKTVEVVEGVPVSLQKQAIPLPANLPSWVVQFSGLSYQPIFLAASYKHSLTAMLCIT